MQIEAIIILVLWILVICIQVYIYSTLGRRIRVTYMKNSEIKKKIFIIEQKTKEQIEKIERETKEQIAKIEKIEMNNKRIEGEQEKVINRYIEILRIISKMYLEEKRILIEMKKKERK